MQAIQKESHAFTVNIKLTTSCAPGVLLCYLCMCFVEVLYRIQYINYQLNDDVHLCASLKTMSLFVPLFNINANMQIKVHGLLPYYFN